MSDNNPVAVRVYALQEAVRYNDGLQGEVLDPASVVNFAQIFLDFLNGTDVKAQPAPVATPVKAQPAPVATPAEKPVKAEKPKPVKAAPPVKAEPTAEEVFEERKTKIGEKVAASLAANKRAEAVAIMEGYGAKSVTQLAQGTADLAEILAKFDEMLLAA